MLYIISLKFIKQSVNFNEAKQKKNYFTNYFKNIIKYIKKAWKGNKSIISLKAKRSESPKSVFKNKGDDLTNTMDIVSSFNNFFLFCTKHSI